MASNILALGVLCFSCARNSGNLDADNSCTWQGDFVAGYRDSYGKYLQIGNKGRDRFLPWMPVLRVAAFVPRPRKSGAPRQGKLTWKAGYKGGWTRFPPASCADSDFIRQSGGISKAASAAGSQWQGESGLQAAGFWPWPKSLSARLKPAVSRWLTGRI